MEKLKKYGFPDHVIEELIKGKVANVTYGKVKYNSGSCTLTTYYPDGQIKKEIL